MAVRRNETPDRKIVTSATDDVFGRTGAAGEQCSNHYSNHPMAALSTVARADSGLCMLAWIRLASFLSSKTVNPSPKSSATITLRWQELP